MVNRGVGCGGCDNVVGEYNTNTLALMLREVKKNGWMIWWMLAWET